MREIDGYTRTCGLVGNPVEHTLSPVIHNTLAELTDRKLCYVPLKVEKGRLEDAVKGAYALNLLGVNVTVPYKSEVIPFLKETDPLAARIGAVNTLVRTEGGFKGYNTDMPGLYRAMCADGVRIEGGKALILGAGGVARAVAVLLAEKGAAEIILLNRTLEKAQRVAEEVNGIAGKNLARALRYEDQGQLSAGERYLAIQATSVGMHPHDGDVVVEDEDFYDRIHTGYDLIFNPPKTRFMQLVESRGGRAFNGSKMLLYQGIIAYELWTGAEVSDEQARRVLRAMEEAGG
ncbi:MAG: shikimate dehydrogenase [Clostridium sp.]|nr:shikimate dehydrogenase [Acetatifactor muris]MCM1527218.1 shikimate dehydrogenase [Bacteroides sp.]MCM1562457.1 shikimate dehydrogenase [Clostridium sp.]